MGFQPRGSMPTRTGLSLAGSPTSSLAPTSALALALSACSVTPPQPLQPPQAMVVAQGGTLTGDCAALARVPVEQTALTAVAVPAGTTVAGERTPAHCLVSGRMSPRTGADGKPYHIGFEVRLPRDWNGRLLFQGGGGNDGVIRPALGTVSGGEPALARGFAVVSTDGGHQGAGPGFRLDPQARADHAMGAYTRSADAAKALVAAAYGRLPDRSYFMGCSGGGRQALMFAQRQPAYFDGIVATAPAMRASREAGVAAIWSVKAYLAAAPRDAAGQPVLAQALSDADLRVLTAGILGRCDALDGAADGIVSVNPSACRFDPAELQCRADKTDNCLSAAQVAALKADFGGPVDSRGGAIYAGFPWDAGIASADWRAWKLGSSPNAVPDARNATLMGANIGYQFTPPDPGFDYLSFDFDRDVSRLDAQARMLSTTSPDLDRFAGHGGKLLLLHGMADPVFSANDTIAYFDAVRQRYGARGAEVARLFLVPGMAHCRGGVATDQYDPLGPLVDWVERGVAPVRIEATAGASTPWPGRTRPLCAFPQVARYAGGDPERAESFRCIAP